LKIISRAEYSAYKKYEPMVKKFAEVDSVKNDEKKHGDILLEYVEKRKKKRRL